MSSKAKTLDLTFRDRRDAGAALGKALLKRRDWQDPVVLGLPRGGVPVAVEVGHAPVPLQDREVILVDDGLATGATMRAAIKAVRQAGPARVTVAVPVGARESCDALESLADDVVCVRTPVPFGAVGLWYSDFPQTSDEQIRSLLAQNQRQVQS